MIVIILLIHLIAGASHYQHIFTETHVDNQKESFHVRRPNPTAQTLSLSC